MGALLSIFDSTPEVGQVSNQRNQNTGYATYYYEREEANTRANLASRSRASQDTGYATYYYERAKANTRANLASRSWAYQDTDYPRSYNKRAAENARAPIIRRTPEVIVKRNRLVDYVDPYGTISEDLEPLPVSEQSFVRNLIWNLQVDIEEFYKVKNEFLKGMYELKKAEYESRYNCSPGEEWLIHATARINVSDIIKNNFDWRRVRRIKYGAGTSFTNNAEYANYYCNNRKGDIRAFIICKVLIFNTCEGKGNEKPPNGYDTSLGKAKNSARIYVKYGDNEFLPVYVAYYKSSDELISRSIYYRNAKPIYARQYRGRRRVL